MTAGIVKFGFITVDKMYADKIVALFLEHGCRDQGVDTAAESNCNCSAHLEKGLIGRSHGHRPGGAGWHTQFADTALLLVETHRHFRSLHVECSGGANGRARAAMGTDRIVAFDFLGGVLYINTLSLKVIDAFLKVLLGLVNCL